METTSECPYALTFLLSAFLFNSTLNQWLQLSYQPLLYHPFSEIFIVQTTNHNTIASTMRATPTFGLEFGQPRFMPFSGFLTSDKLIQLSHS